MIAGNFFTRTWGDIYGGDADAFIADMATTPFWSAALSEGLDNSDINLIFFLLTAEYSDSHIANLNEITFKYQVYSMIYQYGPTWKKEMTIQKTLRSLDGDALRIGSFLVRNHANNPGTPPNLGTDELLKTLDDQTTDKWQKSPLEAYNQLEELLRTDLTREFVNRFKRLFLTIVQPYAPLWFETDIQDEEEDNNEL